MPHFALAFKLRGVQQGRGAISSSHRPAEERCVPPVKSRVAPSTITTGVGILLACSLALLLTMIGPTSDGGVSPRPAGAATPAVKVTVSCKSTPEVTRVENKRSKSVTIRAVGSIYRPYSYEPIRVNRKLGGGRTMTFESGSKANTNKLTGNFIYNNDVGSKEGARVSTSVGRFSDRCG